MELMRYINPNYLFDDRMVLKCRGEFSDVPSSVCTEKIIDFNKWINYIFLRDIKHVDKGSIFDPIIVPKGDCVPITYLLDDACSH